MANTKFITNEDGQTLQERSKQTRYLLVAFYAPAVCSTFLLAIIRDSSGLQRKTHSTNKFFNTNSPPASFPPSPSSPSPAFIPSIVLANSPPSLTPSLTPSIGPPAHPHTITYGPLVSLGLLGCVVLELINFIQDCWVVEVSFTNLVRTL